MRAPEGSTIVRQEQLLQLGQEAWTLQLVLQEGRVVVR